MSLVAPADCEEDEALARTAAVRARFGAIVRWGITRNIVGSVT